MRLTDMRNVMERLSGGHLDAEDRAILTYMKQYFDELLPIELEDANFHNSKLVDDSEAIMNQLQDSIQKQTEVHSRYWCNDSEFYRPNSISSEPEHDWDQVGSCKILRNGDSDAPVFVFLYTYPSAVPDNLQLNGFALRIVKGEPKIDEFLI